MRIITACAALTLLAGCFAQKPITSAPVRVIPDQNPPLEQVAGYNAVPVRVYKTDANGHPREQTGVPCVVAGSGFSARLNAPGLVSLPDLNARTRPITVTCTIGAQQRSVLVEPYNVASAKNRMIGGGISIVAGIVGAITTTVAEASRDKSADSYSYAPIAVTF